MVRCYSCALLLFLALAFPRPQEEQESREADPREFLFAIETSLTSAIEAAREVQAGEPVRAWLEGVWEDGHVSVSYEVLMIDGTKLMEVEIDPLTGRLMNIEAVAGPGYRQLFPGFQRALERAEHDLSAAVRHAEEVLQGAAVGVVLLDEDPMGVAQVLFANSPYLTQARIDVGSGRLIELELRDAQPPEAQADGEEGD